MAFAKAIEAMPNKCPLFMALNELETVAAKHNGLLKADQEKTAKKARVSPPQQGFRWKIRLSFKSKGFVKVI